MAEEKKKKKARPRGYNTSTRGNDFDWPTFRQKYASGDDTITLQSIADESGASYRTVSRRASRENWMDLRAMYREQVAIKALKKASSYEAEIRAQQIQVGKAVIAKGLRRLQELDPSVMSVKETRCYLKDGAAMIRAALGIAQEYTFHMSRSDLEKLSVEELEKLASGETL